MPTPFGRSYPTIFAAFFVVLTATNAYAWRSPWVGALLLAAFVTVVGGWVGRWTAPAERGPERAWLGAWTLLSAVMLVGTAFHYLASFTRPAAVAVALLAVPVAHGLSSRAANVREHETIAGERHRVPAAAWAAATLSVAFLLATAWMLARAATDDAVRSAWELVPPAVFFSFAAGLAPLFALCLRGRERALAVGLSSLALLVFLGAALLLFPLGFGFDPFIHQATAEHVATYGTITPKPFYYAGQYALVLFAHHAFALPVAAVSAALVPVLAALSLPAAWYGAAVRLLRDRRAAAATLPGIFLLPLAPLVLTTPQALANLWALLLALAAVPWLAGEEPPRPVVLAVPALAALAVHPIAGIPAVLFVILLASDPGRAACRPFSRLVFWSAAVGGSVALPLSFVANSLLSSGTLGLNPPTASSLSALSSLSLFFANRFDPILDFAYLYGLNAVAFAVIMAGVGWRASRGTSTGSLRTWWIMAGVLAVNWALLSSAVDFSFLIDYERQNFSARLVPIALSFLAPFSVLALWAWTARVRRGPVSLRAATVTLLAALATAAFYLAYPRHDAYVAGHGYNVSRADLSAVNAIESDAAGASYVVLANQTVSAAAVRELGFARYFGDQFFYPIPTGGDLYALFLRMNDRPSRDVALAALALANERCGQNPSCAQPDAVIAYFVANDYWWEAPRIVETAKRDADAWWTLDAGAVHVFKYFLIP
jgi:hypothetical protein